MKKTTSKKLNAAQQKEIEALTALPDDQIDTSDIPEVFDWRDAKRARFFRPVKKQITLRLDADLIAWFQRRKKPNERGYQTSINNALREYVLQHESEHL